MPQFDVFIFFSSIFYLLIGFFSLMIYNQLVFLPKISAILKLRSNVISNISNAEIKSKTKFFKISKTLI